MLMMNLKKVFESALVLSMFLVINQPLAQADGNHLPKVIPPAFYTNNGGNGTALNLDAKSGQLEVEWFEIATFSGPVLLDADGNFSLKVSYLSPKDPCQTDSSTACTWSKADLLGKLTQTDSTVVLTFELKKKHYVLQAAREPETKTFSGEAVTVGAVPLNCEVLTPPTQASAEAEADKNASEYCSGLLLKSVRVSDFTYSTNNCVWGGPQYHYPSDQLFAEAQYQCK